MLFSPLLLGHYSLPGDIVVSVPVTFTDGRWSALLDVTIGEELRHRLQLSASELQQVKLHTY